MSKESEDIIRQLQKYSSTKMAGAVKTFPLRELLKSEQFIRKMLQSSKTHNSFQPKELQTAYDKLQTVITKRLGATRKIIARFSTKSPEVIALNTSVFSLVPSRDLLEDVRTAHVNPDGSLEGLSTASSNILEAVNIEIQQRFSRMSPENIAVIYSESLLEDYRRLLKNLLPHIAVDSDIFRVYSKIIRNVIEGSRIYDSHIKMTRDFCEQIFDSFPPRFTDVFNQYTVGELESYHATIQSTLDILGHDNTDRPSVIEFTRQCRQTHDALSEHFIYRKDQMRKATRVLQLSHYISFLNPEQVSENASVMLMLCQVLSGEAREFLMTQKGHLDVSLNLNSIEDALQKIEEGLRYRQFAIGQLFQEISTLSSEELSIVPEKRLGDNNLLLQEILHLAEDYIQRSPTDPERPILHLANLLRENIQKLQEAAAMTNVSIERLGEESWGFDRTLPNLSKFYDKELIGLIRKALQKGNASSLLDRDELGKLEASSIIPVSLLQGYIDSFINITNIRYNLYL